MAGAQAGGRLSPPCRAKPVADERDAIPQPQPGEAGLRRPLSRARKDPRPARFEAPLPVS